MGRPCIVCTHQRKDEIEQMIREGVSFRAISRHLDQTDSQKDSIRRHTENHLKLDTAAWLEKKRDEGAMKHGEWLMLNQKRLEKMAQAVDEFLTDPNDPERYDLLSVRENEVTAIIKQKVDDKIMNVKIPLVDLKEQMEQALGMEVSGFLYNQTNPLELYLPVLREHREYLKELGSVEGVYKQPETNPADVQREASKKLYAQAIINDESKPEITNMDEALAYMDKLNSKFQEVQEKGIIG